MELPQAIEECDGSQETLEKISQQAIQFGRPFLHEAIANNNKDIAAILLDKGADVNVLDRVMLSNTIILI
jgi:hypothetical protein